MADVTQILSQIEEGDPAAAEELLPVVYDELRKLAASKLAKEQPGQTLQATALVHEAFLRLVGKGSPENWNGRGHFFAAAAAAMERILVENARRKKRLKHGGDVRRLDRDVLDISCVLPDDEILALSDALERLQDEDAFKARLIQLRFFVGLTNEQAAEILQVSPATAKRHWRYARAWLHREVRPDDTSLPGRHC